MVLPEPSRTLAYAPDAKQSTDLLVNSYIYIKQSFEGQNFPILTNSSRVWSVNHLYLYSIYTVVLA